MIPDFIVVFAMTAIVSIASLAIFAIFVKQVPGAETYTIQKAFDELNLLRRKLSRMWKTSQWKTCILLLIALWMWYIKMKKQNPVGFLDLTIVYLLTSVLATMTGLGFWGFMSRLIWG